MPDSSRHQSSRRAYADAGDSDDAIYDDYEVYSRPLPSHHINEEHNAFSSHRRYRPHPLRDGHRGHHSYVSSDDYEPHDVAVRSPKILVTRYRIGESTTSFHDRREYPAYDSHRSSSGSREEDTRSNRNDRCFEDRERRHHQEVPKSSQRKEPKPTYTDGNSSRTEGYSNPKHVTNDKPSWDRPENGSSRRQEMSHSSRSESRRGENPKSNRDNPSLGDHKQRHEQKVPVPKPIQTMSDHYATLQLDPFATDAEIKNAAKRRRVEVHPDRLKKVRMSDSERAKIDAAAAKVGQAADVLQDPEQKREYDRKLYAANGWDWHRK